MPRLGRSVPINVYIGRKTVRGENRPLEVIAATSTNTTAVFITDVHFAATVSIAVNAPTSSLAVGGTVSFSATINESKNLRLKRVVSAPVGLPRAYQAFAPTATMVRPVLRRTVRRTGKMGSSTSGRAALSYGKSFTVVGSLNKPRFSISAKATLSTTTTAQGNIPSLPATITAGVPAAKMIGAMSSFATTGTTTTYDTWLSQGWGGFMGTLEASVVSPQLMMGSTAANASANYDSQKSYEGIPGPWNSNSANRGVFVAHNANSACDAWMGFGLYPIATVASNPNSGWWDDASWANLVSQYSGYAAGIKFLNGQGIYWDTEFDSGRWDAAAPTGRTVAERNAKSEQRGYEVGMAIYTAFPACNIALYDPIPGGCFFDRYVYNPPNGHNNLGYPKMLFQYGLMRAGAQLNSTGRWAYLDSHLGYRFDTGGVSYNNYDNVIRISQQGMFAVFSQTLPEASRNHWMSKIDYEFYTWAGSDGSGFYDNTQPTGAVYGQLLEYGRRWSGGGRRWEFCFGGNPNSAPGYPKFPPPPGLYQRPDHITPMQAAKNTTSQDTMVVSGAPVGTFNVSAVGRGSNPQATVPLELTATLANETTSVIAAPGVGFYTVPGNVNVGWAADPNPLPAGQSRSFSTLTSPQRQSYTPSAAGTVTLRAKPGDGGVDSDTGTRDQTFTVAAAPTPPPSGARPFTSTSSWNTPVPVGATFTDRPELRSSNWWFDASDFGIVVYTSTPSDPLVTVSIPFNSWNWPISSTQIRIAAGVDGAEGSDGTLCVVSGTDVWDFWQFNRLSDTTAECSASAHTSITTGTGWSLGGGQAAGIRSAGCSSLAGLIQGNTLTNGFDHALAVALRFELVSSAMVRDAISSDGQGGPGAIPMGTRLAIPPNVPRPGSVSSSIAINIWNACKTYGVYVVDTMGGGTVGGFAGNVNTVTTAQSDLLLNAGVWNSPELTAIGHALQLVNL